MLSTGRSEEEIKYSNTNYTRREMTQALYHGSQTLYSALGEGYALSRAAYFSRAIILIALGEIQEYDDTTAIYRQRLHGLKAINFVTMIEVIYE